MEQEVSLKSEPNLKKRLFLPLGYLVALLISLIILIFNVVNFAYLKMNNYANIETFALLIFVFYFYFLFMTKIQKNKFSKNKLFTNTYFNKLIIFNIFGINYYFKNKDSINKELIEQVKESEKESNLNIFYLCKRFFLTMNLILVILIVTMLIISNSNFSYNTFNVVDLRLNNLIANSIAILVWLVITYFINLTFYYQLFKREVVTKKLYYLSMIFIFNNFLFLSKELKRS